MSLRTISDHIADICQNSVKAGGKEITLEITEDDVKFFFKVEDDAGGMNEEVQKIVFDPFYTSRDKKIRRVGLGLPFLKNAAETTGGYVKLESCPGKGTVIEALFFKTNIDCQPVGNIPETFFALITSSSDINWHISRNYGNEEYTIKSDEILPKEKIETLISTPYFLKILKDSLYELEKSLLA